MRYFFLRNSAATTHQSDKARRWPGVNRNALYEFKIRVPDSRLKERVVDVLSAYDELIENNRRRMASLEEAADRLYEEWFVRLRFPGREHTESSTACRRGG